MKAFKLK